jgi:hypothetical protein
MDEVRLRRPDRRECEHCGRVEVWEGGPGRWAVEDAGVTGDVYCLHEWDINGTFTPFERVDG